MRTAFGYNPFSQWMKWNSFYVTFDALEIAKKTKGSEPEVVGSVKEGNLSWPLFMQLIQGFISYSAAETGFDQPLNTPQDFKEAARFLRANGENSFVLKMENCKVRLKGTEKAVDAMQAGLKSSAEIWQAMWNANPFLPKIEQPISPLQQLGDTFKNPEIDLGELATKCADWLEMAGAMQPGQRASGR